MEIQRNRRKWIREVLNPPEIGILYTGGTGGMGDLPVSRQPRVLFVDLLNRSLGGVIIRTTWKVEPETDFQLRIYSNLEENWQLFTVRSKWVGTDPHFSAYNVIGVEFQTDATFPDAAVDHAALEKHAPLPADFEFFKNSRFFHAVPREAVCALLNRLSFVQKKSGEHLQSRGTKNDACFIIQNGTVTINGEQEGELKPIERLYRGDIVCETAILDDQPLDVDVVAEANLDLWALKRAHFDAICGDHPDLYGFLTRLLMERFASNKHSKKRTVGRYLLTDPIGEGSRSVVYKGFDLKLNLPVVIQMVKHQVALDPGFLNRFKELAPTVLKLRHANILKTFEIIEGFRTFFLIKEREDGESLRALLQRWKAISLVRATDFLVQCCLGLEHAHQHGLIHGDLKPSNMMVTPGDRLKILDFGLMYPGKQAFKEPGGELSYIAPELQKGGAADRRSDIYALGVIAYEMITGIGPDGSHAAMEDPEQPVPDPGRRLPGMPDILRRFILKACAQDPLNRFESAAGAYKHLMPLAESYGIERMDQRPEKRRVAVFSLIFNAKDQELIKKMLEEFNRRVKKMKAELKAIDIKEL